MNIVIISVYFDICHTRIFLLVDLSLVYFVSFCRSVILLFVIGSIDFTEKEVNKIVEAGATAVGLGPHRLRVETATIALLATLMLCSDSQQMPIP